jgi:hypothetical protein
MASHRDSVFAVIALAALGLGLIAATSQPASVEWDKSAKGVKLKYPGDWKPQKNPDYELMLLPADGQKNDRRITVDIPDLPPHLPFMIRMSRVEHDYLADLKKEHPDLQVKSASDANLADSSARLIQSTWHANKQAYDDVVLLVIHASSVYIFDAQTDEVDLAMTRAAFDSIKASIQWTKR